MTYGTSHSLIGVCVWGGGGIFRGGGGCQEKILLCKAGGGHYMKNKNIGGGGDLSTQPDQLKRPQCKNAKTIANNYQTLKSFSSLVSLTRHFTKFIFLEQLTAMPQFNMQSFFFLSSHHDTNPILYLYHFRKKYNYILANINSESSRVIFSFFVLIQWVKHFCTPANFVTI